jgi:flagellar hook-associated protein 3 FlgL
MRVTQRAVTLTSLQGLNTNLASLQKIQQQLSSGKTISRPSDDPTGTNTSMVTRQDISGNSQYARNISDGQTFLDATDSAIQDMLSQLQRVRTLTVQALNNGANDPASENDIATEVNGIRESLLGQANQVVQNRPIFGGVTTGSQAYQKDPVTGDISYQGVGGTAAVAAQPLTRRVSNVETIRVDITGAEAFGDPTTPPGKDMFAVVKNITQDVNDPTALSQDLTDLDNVIQGVTTALADVGTREAQMQTAASNNSSQSLSLKAKLSDTEDVDLPKTIMNMQMQQVSYQAALQVTAQALQPTLLDFLR